VTRGPAGAAAATDDGVVRVLSEVAGGPSGEHAAGHRWWTPVRVLLALTAVVFALGMVQKTSCFQDTWTDSETRFTHMCYSDLPYLYTGRGLAELEWPYSGDPEVRERYPEVMEYPVGISYWAWGSAAVAQLVTGSPDLDERRTQPVDSLFGDPEVQEEIRAFVVVNALGFAVLALLSTWLLAGVDRRRPWDAAAFAVAPVLALTALVNWDLPAVVLVAGALWAWSRDRPVLTGVLIGLGTATKLYPLFLLGGVLVIAWRRRQLGTFVLTSASAALAWLLVDLPAMLTGFAQWKVFWTFNSDRGADLGSLWLVAAQAFDLDITPHTVNVVSIVFFGAWCAAVLAVGVLARRTPTLAELGLLVLVGFLLVNKVYSPQYVLWLLPLAVLAVPRWRDQLVWQGTEVLYFACVWWYLGGQLAPGGGEDAGFYWLAILVRVAGELYLVGLVVRDLFRRPVASDDLDGVEGRRGEADADVDLLADGRHARA
jgi:uncharacterized membrane protein